MIPPLTPSQVQVAVTLLPCPFCGGMPELKYIGNDRSKKRAITIRCPGCRIERTDASLRFGFDWIEGIVAKNWNTRKEKS
jgi:hypothetical protein